MVVLHLDKNFKPIDGEEIHFECFTFSAGEPHIKINQATDVSSGVTITCRLNSFHDVGLLCLAADALKRMGAAIENIIIPYFPAARQDRVMVKGEPLSVKVYADIVNSLGAKRITVLDPHSEVTPALLNNCVTVPNYNFMKRVVEHIGNDVILISPDGGALKKIYKVSEYLGGMEVVECSKSRNVKTGELTGFKVFADDLHGKDCVIVDDICDGGGTFNGLAKVLKEKKAGKLYLAVTHGIFSNGLSKLKENFTHIFSTNSIKDSEDESVTIINVKEIL